VILSRGKIVDRHIDLGEVDAHLVERHLALAQVIVEIAFAQVERVRGCRHPGRIGVPVEQVEGHRLAALQVIVDHVGPDQVVGAQQVERR
jgi:hypothetical protein